MATFQTRQYKELAGCIKAGLEWTKRNKYSVIEYQRAMRVLISYLRDENSNMKVDEFYEQSGITDPNTGST